MSSVQEKKYVKNQSPLIPLRQGGTRFKAPSSFLKGGGRRSRSEDLKI